jgi:hypothetical protein
MPPLPLMPPQLPPQPLLPLTPPLSPPQLLVLGSVLAVAMPLLLQIVLQLLL